jgi:hypothetical protein
VETRTALVSSASPDIPRTSTSPNQHSFRAPSTVGLERPRSFVAPGSIAAVLVLLSTFSPSLSLCSRKPRPTAPAGATILGYISSHDRKRGKGGPEQCVTALLLPSGPVQDFQGPQPAVRTCVHTTILDRHDRGATIMGCISGHGRKHGREDQKSSYRQPRPPLDLCRISKALSPPCAPVSTRPSLKEFRDFTPTRI